jgi:hypothetical protein
MHDSIAASVDGYEFLWNLYDTIYGLHDIYIAATVRGCNRMHALFEPSREATTSAFFSF